MGTDQDTSISPQLLQVSWQLAAAFGQGAGTMTVTTDATQVVFDSYVGPLRDILHEWPAHSLRMIEFMRAVGTVAAGTAVRHHRCVITTDDMLMALDVVRRTNVSPFADMCGITRSRPPTPEPLRQPKPEDAPPQSPRTESPAETPK
jgi:hypothetical protein